MAAVKRAAALWRLLLSAAVGVLLYILVVNVIEQPVATDQRSYRAEFTDASGLHRGADVRVRGVRVGKVESVGLERRRGQSVAAVEYTLDARYGVVADTKLAIRYQALTGLRYLDIVKPAEGYSADDLVTAAPVEMTQPSFDVTALFNGLQPVFATLSPDEINTFTANAVAYLSGDGDGLAPMLSSIHTLTQFAVDRQQVIATLMRNMSAVAEALGGNSTELIQILEWAQRPLDAAMGAVDELRKSQLFGPKFTETTLELLANAGFPVVFDANTRWRVGPENAPEIPSVEDALDRAISNVDAYFEAFKLIPVAWENIPEPPEDGSALPCSAGRFELPAPLDILVNGQKVVLCNR